MTLLNGAKPALIRTYQPADLECIVQRHTELYEREYGFGPQFVEYVEKYLLHFHENHDKNRENIWVAEVNKIQVGVIAIVKVDDTTAQLRWFLIDPEMRGRGLGNKLMETVIDFCQEKQYKRIMLWTVSVLDAARYLYQKFGFILTDSKKNYTWAKNLMEERWDLHL